ncbi:VOC family protein [Chitinophaga solisilvae]|uniref:VOC family protein n=1 Tax=Chitinophaga solisilvae TaxID=1233460 RepID=A0A3S1AWA2_9BACT|nr:VOC family protein [Chitinophaga solisilvae]NSL86845.1 VOC family protein [Chitinophaga solisilvae]
MFNHSKAFSGFSVNDLQKAKEFYQQVLELDVTEASEGLVLHPDKGSRIFIYPKPNHQPATFTILNFPVDNIDEAVAQLGRKGVKFLQYGGDIQTDEKGVFREQNIAWFEDPAGNILSVLEEKK